MNNEKNVNRNLHYLSILIFILLISDNPSERPYMGLSSTILLTFGEIFYRSIGKLIGLDAVKIFPIEIFIFYAVYASRKTQCELYHAGRNLLLCIGFLTLYGVVTGGSVRFAALQLRPLICLIYFSLYFQRISHQSFLDRFENIIIYSCLVRSLFGIYLWFVIFRNVEIFDHSMGDGSYIMSHSDSPLCVASLCIVIIRIIRQQKASLSQILSLLIIIFFCILNNRRIFFIELSASTAIIFFSLNIRERVNKLQKFFFALLGSIYTIWAWNSNSTIAYPIQTIKSSITQSDASSMTRGVENYNLIFTMRQNPVLGQGFGHKYIEKIQAYDISHHFNAYEYVPHNSTLWILTSGGILFATFYYNFFKTSANIKPNTSIHFLCTPMLATYFLHCFGDMGAQCWKSAVLIGTIIGAANANPKK